MFSNDEKNERVTNNDEQKCDTLGEIVSRTFRMSRETKSLAYWINGLIFGDSNDDECCDDPTCIEDAILEIEDAIKTANKELHKMYQRLKG